MNSVNQVIDLPLRDIHLPDPISAWPLSFGWWLVIGGSLALIAILTFLIIRWLRPTLKSQATKNLQLIEANFHETSDGSKCIAQISALLRRIVISRNSKNAGVTGKAWLQLLDFENNQEFSQGIGQILLSAPYQKEVQESDVLQLIAVCQKMVNRL